LGQLTFTCVSEAHENHTLGTLTKATQSFLFCFVVGRFVNLKETLAITPKMRLQPYLVDIFLLISFYLIVLVDQLGYCRCCITWLLRLRRMIYNRGKSVEDCVFALSVGGVGEAAVPRDSASNTRLSEKEGCVLLFFFLLILYSFSLTRLGCVVVVAAVTSYSPLAAVLRVYRSILCSVALAFSFYGALWQERETEKELRLVGCVRSESVSSRTR
jgi:hypothetical protein